ncbi:Stonustoxin subunit alpha [Labeo rohita]|uniref:Stonustoxin subunit alpha n=1 Tax=Labeo rohita TaxID=84645 RepID=A0ABQ8MQM1_LABRO|nr:Stonustoxin subunit alpha [Labeo rohita]
MAIAILSMWATHHTPEASSDHESAPEASSDHESAPEASSVHESVPEVLAYTVDPPKEAASIHELTATSVHESAPEILSDHESAVDHGGKSRITAGLKKYACFLTLDPNTANTELILSEEKRKVTFGYQSYPDHPDRFDVYPQVLCRESVCGRCYWEIEWSGDYFVCISVSYKVISRKGLGVECVFGHNDQSWSLICYPDRYSFRHNNIQTDLLVKSISHRIGVYVDVSAGTLSFYSVSDTMSLIHTEQTTFTQPLYPGFTVWSGSSVKLC